MKWSMDPDFIRRSDSKGAEGRARANPIAAHSRTTLDAANRQLGNHQTGDLLQTDLVSDPTS